MMNKQGICRREIRMDNPFLHIPARPEAGACLLRLFLGGHLLHTFRVALSGHPLAYYPLELPECVGQTVYLELPADGGEGAQGLAGVVCGGRPEDEPAMYPALYREPHRPGFHYSCKRGWLNDPNGLFYANGQWHLYYQHNPLGSTATDRNCSWGHAVSPDLFHWEERRPALMPQGDQTMCASGSCLPDTRNALGYGPDAVVAAFTALGVERMTDWRKSPAQGQFFAVSTDGGDTFRRLPDQPAVPCERGEPWRDPCLFADETGYGLAVYETHEGKNMVAFYRSDDLRHWRRSGFAPELFECPDMFPLICEETGETRWALYGGDGAIRVGNYDGETFRDEESRNPLDFGRAVYAGQTWRNAPDGRRVHIAWACGMGNHRIWDERGMGYEGLPFSQCMTTPCELRLRRLNGRYFVSRTPVAELDSLHCGPAERRKSGENCLMLLQPCSDYRIVLRGEAPFFLQVADLRFSFCPDTTVLVFPNGNTLELGERELRIRLLADATTVELFFNELACATYTMPIGEALLRLENMQTAEVLRYPLENVHRV